MSLFSGESIVGAIVDGVKPQIIEPLILPPLSATSVIQTAYIASAPCKVIAVREVHAAAGGAGAAVGVEKLTGTTGKGSGVSILTGPLSLTGAAYTVQIGALAATTNITLNAGDRLAITLAGTLTGLADCILQIEIARL